MKAFKVALLLVTGGLALGAAMPTVLKAQAVGGGLLPPSQAGTGDYPGKRPRPYLRLVGPETLNPGAWPHGWPYPDQYNSVSAAAEVHHLRYTDEHVNFVEVAYFAGVHGQMHGHPFASVFAIDAPTPKSVNERLDPDRAPKIGHAEAPAGMDWPLCNTMGPESPHAETNLDTWPHHFYRIEFKRLEGVDIQKNWKTWYPHIMDPPLTRIGKMAPTADGVVAAPNNYNLLYEDDHVRLVEVTLRPGETEPMHADIYPAVLAMDSVSGSLMEDRFLDPKSTSNGQGAKFAPAPPDFAAPTCSTTGPRAPHALRNTGNTPVHYYRIEFKRIDGAALRDNWRTWYPWMSNLADQTARNPYRPNY